MAIIIGDNKATYFSLSRVLACSSCEKCPDGHEAENSMSCQPCKPGISLFLRRPIRLIDWKINPQAFHIDLKKTLIKMKFAKSKATQVPV